MLGGFGTENYTLFGYLTTNHSRIIKLLLWMYHRWPVNYKFNHILFALKSHTK